MARSAGETYDRNFQRAARLRQALSGENDSSHRPEDKAAIETELAELDAYLAANTELHAANPHLPPLEVAAEAQEISASDVGSVESVLGAAP